MSAVRSVKRAPRFTTYVDVDVDIDPEDLEREGWVYVGTNSDEPSPEKVIDVVKLWHEEEHDTPWRWCGHSLCDRLRGREPNQ